MKRIILGTGSFLMLAAIGIGTAGIGTAMAGGPKPAMPTGNPGTWVTTGDYPPEALRDGAEGAVAFVLAIDPAGRVSDCEITRSSRWPVLDGATCDLVRQRAAFTPATDAAGRPVVGSYANSVRWVIPKKPVGLALPSQPDEMVVTYLVGADGQVSECYVEKATGRSAYLRMGTIPCSNPTTEPYRDPVRGAIDQRFRMTVRVESLGQK